MIDNELRDGIGAMYDDSLVFDNPSFDNSIIGLDIDGRVIYDWESMVYEMCKEDDISWEDAVEFIDYNTIRSLPYAGDRAPIILGIRRENI